MLKSVPRQQVVDGVIAQLEAQIEAGAFAVGDRLPTEPELMAQLGVGRSTVREAVRALAHVGLVEVRQGAGTFVRARRPAAGPRRTWPALTRGGGDAATLAPGGATAYLCGKRAARASPAAPAPRHAPAGIHRGYPCQTVPTPPASG